uniref:BRCT domain-containing protein n=1 Tax=Oryza glumipatula TaxID=40148 RepID=A0A0E0BG95_9ORYZ
MTPSHGAAAAAASSSAGAGRRAATFAGASVFLSRSLVAPEVYDAVHDALRLNGAEVFLCADPARTGPLDFHVISSSSHERFADLRAKGCNLLGPQCILSCAKEHRFLPKQGYTCCLAMDGVKILCSGFEKEEKAKIEQLVTAMGGTLQNKAYTDANFVIAKDVLAAKYKWAVNTLKKPIVSRNWLEQCWIEHRVVPHEPYRIPPFSGLNICITKLNVDERRELAKIIVQNGGQYSANLTRRNFKKTFLNMPFYEPGGDKYVVAQKWGNIHIVVPKWIDQSVARKVCLDESAYLVCQNSTNINGVKHSLKEQHNPEISSASFQPVPTTSVDDSVSTSQYVPASFDDASKICSTDIGAPSFQETKELQVDSHVAEDSEAEDDDLYLSNCRISLVGFEEKESSRLVMMIRNGGGSRHVMLSERLTHIILGAPSEEEKKEVRRLAAWGVINVVKATWLEDCNKAKKEVKVSPSYVANELLAKEFSCVVMEKTVMRETKAAKNSGGIFHIPTVNDLHDKQLGNDLSSERKSARGKHETMNSNRTATKSAISSQQNGVASTSEYHPKFQVNSSAINRQSSRSSNTFKGRTFCFSNSFSHDRRAQVVDWVREGGGIMVDDAQSTVVDFIIESHGQNSMLRDSSHSTAVSTHWIRSCLEEGCFQDVGSHPIFSPLCCRIPFPGFEDFRFCVSQYEEKDRLLLKNLCFILGSKFTEKATKKVTHLICKFASGPKYEAYYSRGIPTITAEWLFECVRQDRIVPFDQFQPKPPTSQDRDAGLCTVSQYPTQATKTISRFDCSESHTESQLPRSSSKYNSGNASVNEEPNDPGVSKRRRLSEFGKANDTSGNIGRTEELQDSTPVPDVADAIEDLLVQSSKIFAPDDSVLNQDQENTHSFGISRHWLNMPQKLHSTPDTKVQSGNSATTSAAPPAAATAYYPFSETQTESQVVGYEEDLTGRQKIIDRVRSQSINVTPAAEMSSDT